MSKEDTAGLNVSSRYGPLNTPDGAGGVIKTEGALNELTIDFTGDQVNNPANVQNPVIPAGSRIVAAFFDTEVLGVMGGTTPNLAIGTSGSEETNGLLVTEAQVEAVGTYNVSATAVGTWALTTGVGLVADTTVAIVLEGDSTITAVGSFRVVVQYVQV